MHRFSALAALCLWLGLASPVSAQPAPAAVYVPTSLAAEPGPPRTKDGHPDLQGVVWTATANFFAPLEGNAMMPAQLVLPEDQAQEAFAKIMAMFMSPAVKKMIEEIDPQAADLLNSMKGFPLVRGERHTRMLVLPANGKLPTTPEARKAMPVGLAFPPLKADNPEDRAPSERCLSSPPPSAVLFDIPIGFVQTPDHVVIYSESSDDARIIPIAARPDGATGSFARWDAEALVIETTGFLARDRVRPLFGGAIIVNPDAKVVERFTRASADELVYQYTVEDSKAYTGPWLAEYSLYRAPYRMYPSSCHEGNYSLGNILSGQRVADERAEAKAKPPAR